MALPLDTMTALRGTSDLRRLVEAVVAATDHDEADWVEWKSTLDLTSKEGCFAVARTVLGLANRQPDRAGLTCEGLGYIIVGAEPGGLVGVASVDPATLDQLIEPYVGGADGPRWAPAWVPVVDGRTVLVVTVEAPRPGDPIFTLRKEFVGYLSGAVFVRKHGRTVPANAADMDALQRRLTAAGKAGGAALEVAVAGDVPLSWLDAGMVESSIEQWANDRHRDLVDRASALEESRRAPVVLEPGLADMSAIQAAIAAMTRQLQQASALRGVIEEEDTRTLEEYIEQVDGWRVRVIEAATGSLPGLYVAHGHGVVTLEVRNLGSRFLPDVEVEVRFDFDPATAVHSKPKIVDLPRPPRAYGQPKPAPMLIAASHLATLPRQSVSPPREGLLRRRTRVEKGSIVVTFEVGDLRQHATDKSDDIYIFLAKRPADGILHGSWKATVRDIDGLLTGTLELPVAEVPTRIGGLLETSG